MIKRPLFHPTILEIENLKSHEDDTRILCSFSKVGSGRSLAQVYNLPSGFNSFYMLVTLTWDHHQCCSHFYASRCGAQPFEDLLHSLGMSLD
jgi:hypothetical protein